METTLDHDLIRNRFSGFLYLVTHNWAIDLEVGQRIYGSLGGFDHYFGGGMGILFS
jgi:hypothetical protein